MFIFFHYDWTPIGVRQPPHALICTWVRKICCDYTQRDRLRRGTCLAATAVSTKRWEKCVSARFLWMEFFVFLFDQSICENILTRCFNQKLCAKQVPHTKRARFFAVSPFFARLLWIERDGVDDQYNNRKNVLRLLKTNNCVRQFYVKLLLLRVHTHEARARAPANLARVRICAQAHKPHVERLHHSITIHVTLHMLHCFFLRRCDGILHFIKFESD